jgi:hypothetical protein
MGKAVGQKFGGELRRCMDRFLALLPKDAVKVEDASALVRRTVRTIYPQLLDETAGMAAGAGVEEEQLFRYRFFVDIRGALTHNCSSLFALGADGTPWLGRTCDIEPEDHWSQICHVRRPKDAAATITTTYLGMLAAVGMNEHGVGFVGGSSPAKESYGTVGIPVSLITHKALHAARNISEVRGIFMDQPVVGKGAVLLAADAAGESCLFEVASGRRMNPVPRESGTTWQACTNFFCSGEIPNADMPAYLYNAYARYGRLAHQLDEPEPRPSREGLERLLAEVAQPGPFIPKGACPLETAYATLCDLKRRRRRTGTTRVGVSISLGECSVGTPFMPSWPK